MFAGERAMSSPDDDRFRVRPGSPKNRQQKYVSQVLRQIGKAGGPSFGKSGARPGSRLGRGHVASQFAGHTRSTNGRRVTIKTRLVSLKRAGLRSTATHLRYIEREGVGRRGEPGQAYGALTDQVDLLAFEARGQGDRHQFRFIVSPEDAEQLEDLRSFTRQLMSRMEADLGTNLDWIAVDHWNTDNPHTHVVLRGKDDTGKDLIIARDYIAEGMRHRANELATERLGPRTELEIRRSLQREVDQERWTGLDSSLRREAVDGLISAERLAQPRLQHQRLLLVGRLQRLQRMGLATEQRPGTWAVHAHAETTLRAMSERGDIVRTLQRAMSGNRRELAIFQPGENAQSVTGRVASKGLVDELYDKGYLVLDGIDGKAHYVALPAKTELAQYPIGAVVEARGSSGVRVADRVIASLAADGLYRTDQHLAHVRAHPKRGYDPIALVESHARRLEALRRAGIVNRLAEGIWQVPPDLAEQGRRYDMQRLAGGVAVALRSHLPIERQIRAIGSTWLDQQLIGGDQGLSPLGFGGEVRIALQRRADFLVEQGLAEKRGQRLFLARNLLSTLNERDTVAAARAISAESGLPHRSVSSGQRVTGIYRRKIMLDSGPYAVIDCESCFSLVPWRPVLEQRLGRSVEAVVQKHGVSWQLGKERGRSIG